MIIAIIALSAGNTAAQDAKSGGCHGKTMPACQSKDDGVPPGVAMLPGLTDDQKTKFKALKLAHMKEMMPLKNQMGEKKAKMKSLMTVDKPDMTAINALIDEMALLHAEMMKKKAAHKQEMRKIMNDEQRLIFDMHSGKDCCGEGHGGGKKKNIEKNVMIHKGPMSPGPHGTPKTMMIIEDDGE